MTKALFFIFSTNNDYALSFLSSHSFIDPKPISGGLVTIPLGEVVDMGFSWVPLIIF
jgi:hypothetical protein